MELCPFSLKCGLEKLELMQDLFKCCMSRDSLDLVYQQTAGLNLCNFSRGKIGDWQLHYL